ncbi:hypothetical protein GH714_002118 [Hevea brasiliensis]|uniref:Bifunctional inhibitor/plant lipid transfer protein/seed storage helical domain-containing protein n=1 Tax=Hevea brasiliensis TaxID=3981 RepID=A0A6A6LH60_HEVBR|nr:hypothetical protein GH714_002118 [Hevea brasiliensis]
MVVNCSRITAKAPSPLSLLPPAPSTEDDCTTVIYDMIDCVPYLSVGSNDKLDPLCCEGLKTVIAINPKCICEGLKSSAQLGIVVNMTRAALLPSDCGVHAPPISDCHISLPPSAGEPDSSSPELPPSEESNGLVPAPAPSKGGAYSISVSFLVLMSLLLVSISVILG